MTIRQIEQEIKKLRGTRLIKLRDWFRKYDSDAWDREIMRDVRAGRLNGLARKAVAEHKAGKTKEL